MEIVNMIRELPWNPNRRWRKRDISRIKRVIIHQELGESEIEGVNHYHSTPSPDNHLSQRGAPHFAYHFGIRKNGQIIQANEYSDITWHTKGQNAESIGIMLVGNFQGPGYSMGSKGPNDQQVKSLEWLVKYLLNNFNLTQHDVFGHYHFGKPACPGTMLMNWIETIREGLTEEADDDIEPYNVKSLQKLLSALGYPVGPVDGIIGVKTSRALRSFQRNQGLAVDGIAGPRTYSKLYEELKKLNNG